MPRKPRLVHQVARFAHWVKPALSGHLTLDGGRGCGDPVEPVHDEVDGDSKISKHLTNLRVYDYVELHKEECMNHVAKRLRPAMRTLAASGKKGEIPIERRGFGRLTGRNIGKLDGYYKMAGRSNTGNCSIMCHTVCYHATSTDEKPQHHRCRVGVHSWCFYQKTLATGQKPGHHCANVHTPLSAEVASHVKDVYARLCDMSLLKRCLKGTTQNPLQDVGEESEGRIHSPAESAFCHSGCNSTM